mgnify:CR=1 FL=1
MHRTITRTAAATLLAFTFMTLVSMDARGEVTAKKTDKGLAIEIDGKPFTTYTSFGNDKTATTPICWPIIGPTGKEMTRKYPMVEGDETEKSDHPWHRSLWFTHGEVNGKSFWDKDPIVEKSRKVEQLGDKVVVTTENDWLNTETNKPECTDKRTLTFGTIGDVRYIDLDVTITATEGDVLFGDTKEGSMGVRVPGTMKVDAKKGGHIVNQQGDTDGETWGKRSPWVDYYGPVEDETLGIAILNHPKSFRFPTWWHVRTYGLFAANPFGVSYFEGTGDGKLELKKGESINLSYRIIFHEGDTEKAGIDDLYKAYSEEKK